MHMPGFEYLLALSAASMAFVGISVIVLVLRQITGGTLTPFHTLLVRYTVECGLMSATFALLPPLLSLTELAHAINFRICSAIFVVMVSVYMVNYVRRRRRVIRGPLPTRFIVLTLASIPIFIAVSLNAGAVLLTVAIWPYAVGVTWLLFQAGVVFLLSIEVFLQESPPSTASPGG